MEQAQNDRTGAVEGVIEAEELEFGSEEVSLQDDRPLCRERDIPAEGYKVRRQRPMGFFAYGEGVKDTREYATDKGRLGSLKTLERRWVGRPSLRARIGHA